MRNKSLWREGVQKPDHPSLSGTLEVDVAIIGGGVTGIAAAQMLSESGFSVALIEKETLGARTTGATTAFLMEYLDTEPSALVDRFGEKKAQRITKAHRDAIDWYEETIARHSIECDFIRCPAYVYAASESERDAIKKDIPAAEKVGMSVSFVEQLRGFANCGALKIENQAKFHPLKFLFAASKHLGSTQIFEHTEIEQVVDTGHSVRLIAKDATVIAQKVLMATHYPLDPQPPRLRFKKAWYRTYVIVAEIPKDLLDPALFEDAANPYHYMRVDSGEEHDTLILGGEDHRSDIPVSEDVAYRALEDHLRHLLPNARYTVTHQWKSGIVEPGDGIAYIGTLEGKRVFYATGYSGNGMTYAIIAAKMFAAYCKGENSPYPEYAAHRPLSLLIYLPKAAEYIEEFLKGAVKNSLRAIGMYTAR